MHHYFLETHFGIQVYWIYLVGILCAVFHFCNGLWNLAYHWGLTVSPRSQRLWGYACGLIGVTLLAAGARVAARVHQRSCVRLHGCCRYYCC